MYLVPGITFYFYKGHKYRIKNYLPKWYELKGVHAWQIELIYGKNETKIGWFCEDELFRKFNANIYLRKEKLKKTNKLNEQFN